MVSKKDNKYELSFKHPGGGKVSFDMEKEEINKLISDLKNLIDV